MCLGLSFVALILAANQCLKYRQRWLDCIRRMRRYATCRLLLLLCSTMPLRSSVYRFAPVVCPTTAAVTAVEGAEGGGGRGSASSHRRRAAALAEIATARLEHAQIELDEKVRARESVEEVARGQTEDLEGQSSWRSTWRSFRPAKKAEHQMR